MFFVNPKSCMHFQDIFLPASQNFWKEGCFLPSHNSRDTLWHTCQTIFAYRKIKPRVRAYLASLIKFISNFDKHQKHSITHLFWITLVLCQSVVIKIFFYKFVVTVLLLYFKNSKLEQKSNHFTTATAYYENFNCLPPYFDYQPPSVCNLWQFNCAAVAHVQILWNPFTKQ